MADWLRNVMEEADQRYNELPDWKKASAEQYRRPSPKDEERSSTTIREPYPREEQTK
jgi:hypothetical protein